MKHSEARVSNLDELGENTAMKTAQRLSTIVVFLGITITAFFTDGNPAHLFEISTASAGGQCGPFNQAAADCKAKAKKRFGPE